MLSRTAEGLFWLGRYVERADNISRLMDSGRRLDAVAGKSGAGTNEWGAMLIAAGCRTTYQGDIEAATAEDAIRHLVVDGENPSSIQSCFAFARGNARAQRGAISADVWAAANDAWRETRDLTERRLCPTLYLGDAGSHSPKRSFVSRGPRGHDASGRAVFVSSAWPVR